MLGYFVADMRCRKAILPIFRNNGVFLSEEVLNAKLTNCGRIGYALRNWLRLGYLLIIRLSICVRQGEIA